MGNRIFFILWASFGGALLAGLLLAVAFPPPAAAGIGNLRPAVLDRKKAQGFTLIRTDKRSGYTALTFQKSQPAVFPGGPQRTLTVREFFDSSDRSFAVVWRGSLRPDLTELLGNLYSHLPPVNRTPNRHRLFFQDNRLLISVVGNSHVQGGVSWDQRYLPPGLSPSRLRIVP